MITTVCMNPSFDKTATVEKLQLGELNRLREPRIDAGGKGINVALLLRRFGADVQCVSCLGQENKSDFLHLLADTGLRHPYLTVEGRIRSNLKIMDEETHSLTELNEPGFRLTDEDLTRFRDLLMTETRDSEYVVFSGSLPGGCSDRSYAQFMEALTDKKCILDASGEALQNGLSAKPYLIKPNLSEAESMLKKKLPSMNALLDAAHFMMDRGAQNVVISLGGKGAMLVLPTAAYFSPALKVEVKSTVGAGDSMIGGMLYGLAQGADLPEAFRCGVAAANASVMCEGTEPVTPESYRALLPKVEVQKL